jgi:DNA repair protein RadC
MQAQKYPIKQWARDDRPREKLLSKTPMALSDSELLAILIHHGTAGKSALELGREVLRLGRDNLGQLGRVSVQEFMKIKGIGEAKAITLAAALELGRRRQQAGFLQKPRLVGSREAAAYFRSLLGDLGNEVLGAIFLNSAAKVNHFELISRGGISSTVADPRVIFRIALESGATGLLLCHNHPSGNLKPSQADRDLTIKIRDGARLLDIRLLDHLIVSSEGYFSFADEGILLGEAPGA